MKIYCAYDSLNSAIDRATGEEIHVCSKYETSFCCKCNSQYDGNKIKKYMEDNPKEH